MSSVPVTDWKQEPLSPIFDELTAVSGEDVLLYWIDLEHQHLSDLKHETENVSSPPASIQDIDSELPDNFDNLEDLNEWIKQEPFSNWLDEKILPMSMFDMDSTILSPSKTEPVKSDTPDNAQNLLKEFESVFDYVNPVGPLTPPQSPPYVQQHQPPLLATLEPMSIIQSHHNHQHPPAMYLISSHNKEPSTLLYEKPALVPQIIYTPESLPGDYAVPQTPQSNIAHELAVVDELVRSRAQDMVRWSGESNSSSGSSNPPSPTCSLSNSGSNYDDSCSSSSDDPEWVPEPVDELAFAASSTKSGRKRFKPYSRVPPEDKKSRKKEQNKNAATRYRLKKKAEVEEIINEERSIQKENDDLANKVSDLQREIRYLKGLMRDLFKAKGLID